MSEHEPVAHVDSDDVDDIIHIASLLQDRAERRVSIDDVEKIAIELDISPDQVKEALEAGADSLLLDNMSPDTMREAAKIVEGRITLEASGGITLETVRAKAESGVDLISTGKITQSAPSVDIGLDDVVD